MHQMKKVRAITVPSRFVSRLAKNSWLELSLARPSPMTSAPQLHARNVVEDTSNNSARDPSFPEAAIGGWDRGDLGDLFQIMKG